MVDSRDTPILAIDGGGMRGRFALQTANNCMVAETGPANGSTHFDGAILQLHDGIAAPAKLAETRVKHLYDRPAFVGLAGAIGTAQLARLKSTLPQKNVSYADVGCTARCGALQQNDGVVAHCGTGCFLAAQTGRNKRFAGGWGAILGDEASAQWIGRLRSQWSWRWRP